MQYIALGGDFTNVIAKGQAVYVQGGSNMTGTICV
jgi:hypothetical protein